MTPAVEKSVTALRALVTDDLNTFRRLQGRQDADERRAFAVVLTAAFNQAAVGKFGINSTVPDVIEFVADARVRYVGPETISADAAEEVIRAALGEDDLIDNMDGYTFGAAQAAMLIALVRDGDFSGEEIDSLLAAAGEQASSFFEQ